MQTRQSIFGVLVLILSCTLIASSSVGAGTAAAAGSSYISTQSADMFWCTSTQPFCVQNTVTRGIPQNTPVQMVCWRDDRDPFNTNGKSRWFYSLLGNGQEGYLWSAQVGGQTTTPPCSDFNWVNVSDFGIGHIGTTRASDSEARFFSNADWAIPADSSGAGHWWSDNCAKFAWLAWHIAGGSDMHTGPTAQQISRTYSLAGGRPPRGALVFFSLNNSSGPGHVGVSLGNWQFVGTTGLGTDPANSPVAVRGVLDSGLGYLGWVYPGTPKTPFNPS
jgi:hypothetical protein